MRRILSFLLAIALMLNITLSCYAAEISKEDDADRKRMYLYICSA